jgi:hypothetical protein
MEKFVIPAAIVLLGLLASAAWVTPAAAAETSTITCNLQRTTGEFRGSCDVPCLVNALAIDIDGPRPGASCNTPPRNVPAAPKEIAPGKFLGTMEGKFPEDPKRFELLTSKPGVAKTPFGWFALQEASVSGDMMQLTISAGAQLPPTIDDIRIIRRASMLLADPAKWNRQDDRSCPPDPQSWSLFCALRQATTEVSGGVHYRQPALQAVREEVAAAYGSHVSKHRLMEFNNDNSTTLAAVQGVLTKAQAKLESRLRR